jgi:hypothetical protein
MFNSLLGEKMANLKIYDLHTTDSEMHELTKTSQLKIHDLPATTSQIHQPSDDELQNIVGGYVEYSYAQESYNFKPGACLRHGASCPDS